MAMVLRKVGQVVGLFLLAGTLFLVLSVSSYSPDDPAGNYYVSHGTHFIRNRGGAVGAVLADWALQALGCTVLLMAAIAAISAYYLCWGRLAAAVAVAWRGLLCLGAMSACVYLTFTRDPLWGPTMFAGGMAGKWLADSAVVYLSRPGAPILFSMIAIGTLCIGVQHPLLTALWKGLWSIGRGSWRLALWVPRGLVRMGGIIRALLVRMGGMIRALPDIPLERSHASEPVAARCPADTSLVTLEATRRTPLRRRTPEVPALASTAAASTVALRKRHLVVPILPAGSAPTAPVASVGQSEAVRSAPAPHRTPELPSTPPLVPARIPLAPQPTAPAVRSVPPQPGASGIPSLDLLDTPAAPHRGHSPEELEIPARLLEQKLREFGVDGEVVQAPSGPVITMYEFAPATGVKVNKIVSLQDDLARVMEAVSVRVVAPIPGKAVVGIEIPHKRRETVCLRDVLDSEEFRTSTSKLSLALGKDILGRPVITDLALIPHLLIAGATGSGKSVGLNSLICSLLLRATTAEVRLIMIDPKMLEFSVYEGIPHLWGPVVTESKKAADVLNRVVDEMTRRYKLLAACGVRSIAQYNQRLDEEGRDAVQGHGRRIGGAEAPPTPTEKLPYLVVVIDELSDLMMVSARKVEDALMRLAQMARAAGIHLIVATQRPSVDVLTGVIKANFPARLSFQVTSKVDSRTILDMNGAETLLGRGDMLFLAPGTSKPQRIHGAYVSEAEISRVVEALKAQEPTCYKDDFAALGGERAGEEEDDYDEKYDEALALVTKTGQASISMLQRRLRVGYNRAARMIEVMEREGVVGPADGVKPREVLARNTFDEV